MMKVELKNIKYAAFASQETACFEATIYIDGVKSGSVSNDGQGGADSFSPYQIEERLNAYGKTLPKKTYGEGMDGEYERDAETIVAELLDEYLFDKDVRRLLKNKIAFVADGKVYTHKPKVIPLAQMLADKPLMEQCIAKWKATAVLNLLPFEEAKTLYKTHSAR